MVYIAIGSAISILIGQRLGAGETHEAKDAAWKMILFSLLIGIGTGAVVALLAPLFPQLYNTSDGVRKLATDFALVVALASPLNAFLNATYFTLRSGGKTVVTFLFDSCYIWGVSMLLAFILTHFTSLPILAIYFICQMVDIFKCLLGGILVQKGIWIQNITKTE